MHLFSPKLNGLDWGLHMKAKSPVHVPLHGAMVKIIYIKGIFIIQHLNLITLDII